MIYCLNPDCKQPINVDHAVTCESCHKKLAPLLRGRYRTVRALGQGGFGKTFLAVDEDRLKARCVIKQFSPQVKSVKALEKAVQLFEQEAVRLNELGEHPHIPSLLAYFEQDQRLYLVQQFIEGETLAQELTRRGCFSEQKIREVMAGLLPILKFVHDRHVIHRDITPANIIRRKLDHRLVLIDFGVAKVLQEGGSDIVTPGTKIGTEGYAPIEQLRSGRAFPASDLYSLGATCLYLLTQTKPEELYNPVDGQWQWRSKLAERGLVLTDGMGRILDRMLKDLVSERYQSVAEVMADLRTVLSQPLPTTTTQTMAQVHEVGMTQPPRSQGEANVMPDWDKLQTGTFSEFPNSAIPTHIREDIVQRLPRSSSHSSEPLPPPHLSRPPESDVRTAITEIDEIHEIKMRVSESVSSLPISSPPISSPPISSPPVSSLPVSSSPISAMPNHLPPVSGEDAPYTCISTLRGHTSWVLSLAASSDAQTLVSGGLDDRIMVWDLVSGDCEKVLEGHTKSVNGLAVAPNGQTLVSCSDDISLKFWDLQRGVLLRSRSEHTRDINSIAISADGQFLISGAEDRSLCAWRMNSGEMLRSFPDVSGMVRSVCISGNSQWIASGGFDNIVRVWNFNTTQLVHRFAGHRGSVQSVAISESGRLLVSGSKDRTICIWNTQTGEMVRCLRGHLDSVNAVALTPDGKYLLSGSSDQTIRVWILATGELITTLREHQGAINAIVVSPNQKWFASGSSDNSIRVWKL
jgi:WD40 repeat protein